MSFLPSLPNASLMEAFQAYPELAKPIHQLAQTMMRGASPFTEGERELIAAFVSYCNQCEYCCMTHTAVAEKFGYSRDLMNHFSNDFIPAKMKPILDYVQKLNFIPNEIEQADINAILDAGWNETAIAHTALICGFFNFINRWVDGLGIKPTPFSVVMVAEHLYDRGYRSMLDVLEVSR